MASRSHNFNNADSTTTTDPPSDGGSGQIALSGIWGIDSGRCRNVSAGTQEVVVWEASSARVIVRATLAVYAAGGDGGLIVRATDNSNYWLLWFSFGGGQFRIYRCEGGSFTQEASGSATIAQGDVVDFRADGTTLTGYQNDVQRVTYASATFNQSATKHGLRVNGENATRYDDMVITDLNAAASVGLVGRGLCGANPLVSHGGLLT